MNVRHGIAVASTLISFTGVASAQELTIASWGGAYQDVQRTTIFTPFAEKTGVKVAETNYLGGWGQFQVSVETGTVPFDVVQVEAAELARGCEEGVFLELDWSQIAPQEDFVENGTHPCGVGQSSWATVITYNTDTIGTPPTKLADFWDLSGWPGKRGLRKGPKFNLEFALMADGVPPNEVYGILTEAGGIDRAFAKLDQIKDEIIWWETGVQPGEMVTSGDVAMSMAYSNRIAEEINAGRPQGMFWDGNLNGMDYWGVMAKSDNIDAAYSFLKYYATPEPQVAFGKEYALGPSLKAAWDDIPTDKLPVMPSGDVLELGVFTGDTRGLEFWIDNLQEVTERWNAWTVQ